MSESGDKVIARLQYQLSHELTVVRCIDSQGRRQAAQGPFVLLAIRWVVLVRA